MSTNHCLEDACCFHDYAVKDIDSGDLFVLYTRPLGYRVVAQFIHGPSDVRVGAQTTSGPTRIGVGAQCIHGTMVLEALAPKLYEAQLV